MNKKFYDALTASIYVNSMTLAGKAIDTDDRKLRASGLYPDWAPGVHKIGEIYNAEGQTWQCFAGYDNAIYPDIKPGASAWFTFNKPLHGKSALTARPFVAPTGAHDTYKVGEYAIFTDGKTYRCISETAYSPRDYAQAWEAVE